MKNLLDGIESTLNALYTERGVPVAPRFSMALMYLADVQSVTIKELAEYVGVRHAAMSQSAAARLERHFVTASLGTDRCHRRVVLAPPDGQWIPFLQTEWAATEAAIAEVETSLPYALGQAGQDFDETFPGRLRRDLTKGQDIDGDS